MQLQLQMGAFVLMALASVSTSAALPGAQDSRNWELKCFEEPSYGGQEYPLKGSGSGCHDFPHKVSSYQWTPDSSKGCRVTLYEGPGCSGSQVDQDEGTSYSEKDHLSSHEHRVSSVLIEVDIEISIRVLGILGLGL